MSLVDGRPLTPRLQQKPRGDAVIVQKKKKKKEKHKNKA
jgi:hypothetical protein